MKKMQVCAALVALAATFATAAQQASDSKIPCYDEMAQEYEWETQLGKGSPSMLAACPGAPSWTREWSIKTGGTFRIQVHGKELSAVNEEYGWGPVANEESGQCVGVKKQTTRRTLVIKDGVEYEVTVEDGQPPQRTVKKVADPLHEFRVPNDPHTVAIPDESDAYVDRLGTDSIAGHTCQKFGPKTNKAAGGAKFVTCAVDVPTQCPLARLLEPLDTTITAPDGTVMTHGRTTRLQFGGSGKMVPPNAITPH